MFSFNWQDNASDTPSYLLFPWLAENLDSQTNTDETVDECRPPSHIYISLFIIKLNLWLIILKGATPVN